MHICFRTKFLHVSLYIYNFLLFIENNIKSHNKPSHVVASVHIYHLQSFYRHQRRDGRVGALYLIGMEEIPSFAQWLQAHIQVKKDQGVVVPNNVDDSY